MSQIIHSQSRRYRHVLCVYPYRRELKDLGFLPPLGLEYIAAVIEPYAETLEIVDLRYEPGRTADFMKPHTDLVCFSVNWDREREFVCGEIASLDSAIPVVLGGRHVTEDPDGWLKALPNVDAVIRGDGEEVIEQFCQAAPWASIEGLSWRDGGQIVHNPNRRPGSISETLVPARRYRRHRYEVRIKSFTTGLEVDLVAGSRGCPFNCTFCSFARNPWGVKRPWSARSPESIVKELESMTAPVVAFTDDLFNHDIQRVERLCDLIVQKGIKKKYIVNARLEIAKHPAVLRKMEQAGFAVLLLGIESAHDKTLRSMRKGFFTDDIRRYCKVLETTRMFKHGYFILGNIGESVEEIRQIASFARAIRMDTISLSTLRLSPYSGLEQLVAQNPGYHISSSGKIYPDFCPSQEMRKLRRQINRQFYNSAQILRIVGKARKHGALRLIPAGLKGLTCGVGHAVGQFCRNTVSRR